MSYAIPFMNDKLRTIVVYCLKDMCLIFQGCRCLQEACEAQVSQLHKEAEEGH